MTVTTKSALGLVHIFEVIGDDAFIAEEFAAVDKLVVLAILLNVVDLNDVLLQGPAVLVDVRDFVSKVQLYKDLRAVARDKKGDKEKERRHQCCT
jgi:hypothetical protein